MAITCSVTVRAVDANGQDIGIDIQELMPGTDQVWNEVPGERVTEELDLGGGVTADRITSFTMLTPAGTTIRFNFDFS